MKIAITALMLALSLQSSAKDKPKAQDFPSVAHVISCEHQAFGSRVEAKIHGKTYILTATDLMLGHRCHASKMNAKVSLQAGADYPARAIKYNRLDGFQFLIPDEKHPLCDLEVDGIKTQ
jgi:hypothetical protein